MDKVCKTCGGYDICIMGHAGRTAECPEWRPKWIPVGEALPEEVGSYIVLVECKYDFEEAFERGVDVASYDPYSGNGYIDDCWNTFNDWNEGQEYLHITHWMPLPEPPKEVIDIEQIEVE